jgi:hypothetical protein
LKRYELRKNKRQAEKLLGRAKQDMHNYVVEYAAKTEGTPTEWELKAWQAGYIAGLNRSSNWEKD